MATQLSLITAEKTLLRLAVEKPEYIQKITIDDLISDTAKNLYKALLKIKENNLTVNKENLAAALSEYESSSQSKIEVFYEMDLPSEIDFDYWKKILAIEKAKNTIQESIVNGLLPESSQKEGSIFDFDKVDNLISTVHHSLDIARGRGDIIKTAPQLLKRYEEVIEERAQGNYYFDTGCHHLNSVLTEGFAPGKITTLYGGSGFGKSSYALYLVNKQINKQIPNLYISLEMDEISTMDRLIAQRNDIPIRELIPNSNVRSEEEYMTDYIMNLLSREKKRLGRSTRFHFIEDPGLSIQDVAYYIDYVKRMTGLSYLIVTIDLITMLKEFAGNNKASIWEDAMNKVSALAKQKNVHIIGIVQAKRPQTKVSVNTREDARKLKPQINEIKNSAIFEERSRIILSVFREKFIMERFLKDDPNTAIMSDMMELYVEKQSMGEVPQLRWYVYKAPSAKILPYKPAPNEKDPYIMSGI